MERPHIQFSWERGRSKIDVNPASELIKHQSEESKQCSVCKQRGMVVLIPPVALSEHDLELFSLFQGSRAGSCGRHIKLQRAHSTITVHWVLLGHLLIADHLNSRKYTTIN